MEEVKLPRGTSGLRACFPKQAMGIPLPENTVFVFSPALSPRWRRKGLTVIFPGILAFQGRTKALSCDDGISGISEQGGNV